MADAIQESLRLPAPSPTGLFRGPFRAATVLRGGRALRCRWSSNSSFSMEYPPDQMLRALAARPGGVEPLDALLAEGLVSEEQYYRGLARHLGCAYYDGELSFAGHFDAIKSLRSGVAPLAGDDRGPHAVIAPRAQHVPRLIESRAAGLLHPGAFAVASPRRFAALVRMRRGDEVLAGALARLPDSLSAKRGLNGAQIVAAGLTAVLAISLGVTNIHALTGVASLALWLQFSASILLRSAAAVAHAADAPPPPLSDDELPTYSVVVPLFREADVVEELVRALDAIDYPKGKLEIKLVVERRDDQTLSRLLGMRLPARYEIVVAPPGEPSTKPRALNIALTTARGEFVVVYDAEDAPSPDQLRLAAARFAADRDLDCVQARLDDPKPRRFHGCQSCSRRNTPSFSI